MKKEFKVIKLESDHPAYKYGDRYNVQLLMNGYYCGHGKFCKDMDEVENFIQCEIC